jgi:hypothetical protein
VFMIQKIILCIFEEQKQLGWHPNSIKTFNNEISSGQRIANGKIEAKRVRKRTYILCKHNIFFSSKWWVFHHFIKKKEVLLQIT